MLGRSRRNAFISAVLGISLAMIVQHFINLGMGVSTVLGLGVGGAFGTLIVSIIISVALAEFFGRMCETAKKDELKKEFNYDTHTYDSEKNGKLKSDGVKNLKDDQKNQSGTKKSSKGKVNA